MSLSEVTELQQRLILLVIVKRCREMWKDTRDREVMVDLCE